jgi:hypothetical protein
MPGTRYNCELTILIFVFNVFGKKQSEHLLGKKMVKNDLPPFFNVIVVILKSISQASVNVEKQFFFVTDSFEKQPNVCPRKINFLSSLIPATLLSLSVNS